ncbi:1-deoxy-D-xylulose-5-phosphate synthase N-terminal domain-containing protein [Streptomyces sp. NPDC002537]
MERPERHRDQGYGRPRRARVWGGRFAVTATNRHSLKVSDFAQLWKRPAARLPALARRTREFLIETVCASGGLLVLSLPVGLAVALYRLLDSSRGALVLDAGRRQTDAPGCPGRAEPVQDPAENRSPAARGRHTSGVARSACRRGGCAPGHVDARWRGRHAPRPLTGPGLVRSGPSAAATPLRSRRCCAGGVAWADRSRM